MPQSKIWNGMDKNGMDYISLETVHPRAQDGPLIEENFLSQSWRYPANAFHSIPCFKLCSNSVPDKKG